MKYKSDTRKLAYIFVDIVSLIFVISLCILTAQVRYPDLIISNVELEYVRPDRPSSPGQPVRGSDNLPYPRLNVTVKNIGDKDFFDSFYIAYTNNERDILQGRYSHLMLVNSGKDTIKVDTSIIVHISVFTHEKHNHIKFYIPSDGKEFNGHVLPFISEASYDNNFYEGYFHFK